MCRGYAAARCSTHISTRAAGPHRAGSRVRLRSDHREWPGRGWYGERVVLWRRGREGRPDRSNHAGRPAEGRDGDREGGCPSGTWYRPASSTFRASPATPCCRATAESSARSLKAYHHRDHGGGRRQRLRSIRRYLRPAHGTPTRRLTARPGSSQGERGFDQWLRAMEARGTSVNQGSFLGGGTLRAYAVGSRMGEASPAELDSMKAVVRRAMEDGAFGVATALIYAPGNFASTAELGESRGGDGPLRGRLHHPPPLRGQQPSWKPLTRRSRSGPVAMCRWRSFISRPAAGRIGPRRHKPLRRSIRRGPPASTFRRTCIRM